MDQNNRALLEKLFREYYEPLCRYVYRITGNVDDALESVQEAFLRFYRLNERVEFGKEAALLFRLARNLSLDLLRRRHVRETYRRDAITARQRCSCARTISGGTGVA